MDETIYKLSPIMTMASELMKSALIGGSAKTMQPHDLANYCFDAAVCFWSAAHDRKLCVPANTAS